MNTEKMQDEIAWMKQLAEEGRSVPMLGGNIGIWWALITSVMMLFHWATVTERLPFPVQYIGLGWLAYAVIGVTGSTILGKNLQNKPGANAINNRIISASWAMVGTGIGVFVIGCIAASVSGAVPFWIINAIMPVSFMGYGIANGIIFMLFKHKASGVAAAISFVVVIAMLPLLLNPVLYLLAAISVLIVIIPPSLLTGKPTT